MVEPANDTTTNKNDKNDEKREEEIIERENSNVALVVEDEITEEREIEEGENDEEGEEEIEEEEEERENEKNLEEDETEKQMPAILKKDASPYITIFLVTNFVGILRMYLLFKNNTIILLIFHY